MIQKRLLVLGSLFFAVLFTQAQTTIQDTLLYRELVRREKVDQYAAVHAQAPESDKHLTQEEWDAKKDSIFRDNKVFLEGILNEQGFPGYDKIGKSGSGLFWLLAQHADFDPVFQQRVLDSMKVQVDRNNANPRNYAYLTDRVLINTGEKQVYGTQTEFHVILGKAYSKPTIDPANLNQRRASMNLEPIEDYLADSTASHMEHNSTIIKGITDVTVILSGLILIVLSVFYGIFRFIRKRRRKA